MRSFSRVLITDKNQNILVIQDRKDMWNLPGGKMEPGETPLECATRETLEEVGLETIEHIKLYEGNFIFNNIQWQGYFYFARKVRGVPKMNELDKIKGLRFINDYREVTFHPELTRLIPYLFEEVQKLSTNN